MIESEYHAIVNPDIELIEDAFTPIIKYMDNNRDVGMCIPNIVDEKGERLQVYRKELTVYDMFIRMFCKHMFPKRIAETLCKIRTMKNHFKYLLGRVVFWLLEQSFSKN